MQLKFQHFHFSISFGLSVIAFCADVSAFEKSVDRQSCDLESVLKAKSKACANSPYINNNPCTFALTPKCDELDEPGRLYCMTIALDACLNDPENFADFSANVSPGCRAAMAATSSAMAKCLVEKDEVSSDYLEN